ncbi:hypothetical protein PG911_00980 [Tenacibaculum ovolyticum]|uniref:hypothetical protein n=1 Tax=Tenacibaculum ovolyticum TaxID=104270 RepID=UPI0007EC7E6B|nr:hypothetical protein [Tenacibaculum ovolyticum]WBX76864.1 hypothetical protein PG911_00980 [Tenacibaculum ovolyticum]
MKNLKLLKESLRSKVENLKELTRQELKQINGGGNIGDWFATLEQCQDECSGGDWGSVSGHSYGEGAICVRAGAGTGNGYECDHDS